MWLAENWDTEAHALSRVQITGAGQDDVAAAGGLADDGLTETGPGETQQPRGGGSGPSLRGEQPPDAAEAF